jgi:uncharacterized membrane protein YphA (DoxX/SURF4 family)
MTFPFFLAHEKWFYTGPPLSPQVDNLFHAGGMNALAVAIGLNIVGGFLWWLRGRREVIPGPSELGATPRGLTIFYAILPLILAVHLAIPLLANAVNGRLLSQNNVLAAPWTYYLGVIQTGVALALFYGLLTRVACLALVLLWCSGLAIFGFESMAENVHVLGYAVFFFLVGRGPVSLDRLLLPKLEPSGRGIDRAMTILRVSLGLTLVVLAFTEKLLNLDLAEAFLQQHPVNFMRYWGCPMSDRTFAVCGGSVELAVGLLLMFGIFPRCVIFLAWLPLNMTLMVFNWAELVGHLPFYGGLAVYLFWTPSEQDARLFREGIRDTLFPAARN